MTGAKRVCVFLGVLLLICNGCAGSSVREDPVLADGLPGSGYSVLTESTMDTQNMYPSTVWVETVFSDEWGLHRGGCSGVLVHPRLVLTAAHCLCRIRKVSGPGGTSEFVADKTDCMDRAGVKTVFYKPDYTPPKGDAVAALYWPSDKTPYMGTVVPHPEYRAVYTDIILKKTESVNADLGVIHLDDPATHADTAKDVALKPIRLSARGAEVSDEVIMVGYGKTEQAGGRMGERFYGLNRVSSLEEDGNGFFRVGKEARLPKTFKKGVPYVGKRGPTVRTGDSGGPCFWKNRDGTVALIGIASELFTENGLEFTDYTDTAKYKDWIKGEIAKAEANGNKNP